MDATERNVMNRLTEALTRVGSAEDARKGVLELISDHTHAVAHLADLDKLAHGVLDDIRYGPLFTETKFGEELTRFLWSNPILPHLPRLREKWIFRQREIVGNTLWYNSSYFNDYFRRYNIDDSVVLMFEQSRYGLATASQKNDPISARTMRFLKYLHPLIENGLLNLKHWDDRWLCAGAVHHLAEATLEAIAAVRNGKLLAATGPARAILGLRDHGEVTNLWLNDFLNIVSISGPGKNPVLPGADGRQYTLSILSAPYADDGGVLLVRMTLVQTRIASNSSMRARDFGLSEREADVMSLAIQGKGAKEIANTLGVAYNTARAHLRNAYAKLGVSNRVEAANRLQSDPSQSTGN